MKKQLPLLKEQIIDNWLYKVVALFVAVAIWVTTTQGRKDTILWRNLDIEFILQPNLVVTNMSDRTVRVKVSGPRSSLKKISQATQVVTLNLTHEQAGRRHIEIKPSDINLPMGVKLLSIQPDAFDVDIIDIKK